MSKTQDWPAGWQMPGPQAVQHLQMPHPGTDKAGKCPAVARGGGGGGWAQVELTDALGRLFYKSSRLLQTSRCHGD